MAITVAIVAQGKMGAGVGRRLVDHGVEVRTLLAGRSAASAERARAAGMRPAADARELLDGADFFLSILPPGEALALARQMAPALSALARKPIYVDCNAVSPQTAAEIAAAIAPTGAEFVDAGIIGGPPREGYSPAIYAAGPAVTKTAVLRDWGLDWRPSIGRHSRPQSRSTAVTKTAVLRDWGLDWRPIDGPIGAASGLKMSYAGITKGTTAIACAMLLGAARFGCEAALIAELTESQPEMLERFRTGIPRMYDKAYRWVAEMQEIADFLEQNPPSHDIYVAVARLYDYLATAYADKQPGPDNAVK